MGNFFSKKKPVNSIKVYDINIIKIKRLMKQIEYYKIPVDQYILTQFLSEVPHSSNYYFEPNTFSVIEENDFFSRSTNPISTHIRNNVSDSCSVSLTELQYGMYKILLAETIQHHAINNLQSIIPFLQ